MGKRTTYDRLIQSTAWRKLRKSILRETPLCTDCLEKDMNTSATDVHHIRPVEAGVGDAEMESLCFDRTNLVALCHECHNERHRKMKSHSKESIQESNRRTTDAFCKKFF